LSAGRSVGQFNLYDLLEKELNKEQRDAVTFFGEPLLIIAPAGSGKTKVITYKIAYLIDKYKITPSKIVALTFTNKAAEEMKERVQLLLPEKGKYVITSTFHSFAVRLLRKYAAILGYKPNFSIYDANDSEMVIKKLLKEMNLDVDPKIIASAFSYRKNSTITDDSYAFDIYDGFFKDEMHGKLYSNYINYCKSHNIMDFDDLLLNLLEILTRNEDEFKSAALDITSNVQYLLVDEYQDTNVVQYNLILELLGKNRNITVVGDDDQGIYSFRGSTVKNILRFEKDFKDCKIINLEKNYRSSEVILHAAHAVIKHNKVRKDKIMKTNIPGGSKITVFEAQSSEEEAMFVYENINNLLFKDGIRYKDIAILYRNNHLSRAFEELFIIKDVRHKVWGGYNFYAREEIRDISSYLFTILNPFDEVSLIRVINTPRRGIGSKCVEKLIKASLEYEIHIFEVMQSLFDNQAKSFSLFDNYFTNSEKDSIRGFYRLITDYQKKFLSNQNFASTFNELISEINYLDYIKNQNDDKNFEKKIGYIESFISSLYNYQNQESANIYDIASRIRLLMSSDQQEQEEDCINLMTIHSAKGLEFKVVFIVAAEEGIIPSQKIVSEEEFEEERRLFYVAMTRSKMHLFISYCNNRSKFGKKFDCFPSRFIDEIPEEDIQNYDKTVDITITTDEITSIKNMLINKKGSS